jgi:hypothetical protein
MDGFKTMADWSRVSLNSPNFTFALSNDLELEDLLAWKACIGQCREYDFDTVCYGLKPLWILFMDRHFWLAI